MHNVVNIILDGKSFTINKRVVVAMDKRKRASMNVSQRTKDTLDSIKHPGQSYDGLLQELIKFWKEKRGEYWTRRREQGKAERS